MPLRVSELFRSGGATAAMHAASDGGEKRDGELAAVPQSATFHRNGSAMQFAQPLDQRQSDAERPLSVGKVIPHTLSPISQLLLVPALANLAGYAGDPCGRWFAP